MNRGISLVLSLILAWPTSLSAAVSLSSQAGRSAPIPALGFQPGSTNALLPVGDLTLQTALPGASGLSAPEAVLPAALETVAPAAAAEPTAAAPQLAALAATPSAALAAPQAASERVVAPRTTALAVKDEQAAAKPTVLQGTEQLSKAVAAAPTSALNAAFDNAAGLGDASPAPGTAVAEPGGPGHNNLSGGGDGGEPKRPEPPAPAPRSSILRSLRVGFIAATALMAAKLAMLGAGAGLLSQAVYALGVDGHYTPGMAEEAAQSIVAQPLVEELTFRVAFVGAALYAARGKKGAAAAFWPIAVVSSFLFAAMHANSAFGADMFLAHALAGMTFAWVFRKEGLAAAWAAHGFGNLLVAIAGVAFIGYASLSAAGSSFALAPLVLPAAAVLGLAYLAWRGLRAQKADVAAGKLQAYRLGPIGAALFASVIGAYLLTPAGMATTLWYMAAAAALISYGLYKSVSAASRKGALAAGLATALLIFGAENKPYHWWKYGGEPLTRAPVAYVVGDEQLLAGPFADPAIADEAAPILRQWRKNGFFYFQDIRRAVEILSKSNDARATKILEFIFERGEGVLGEMRWLDETLTTELAKRGSPVIRSTVRDYERLERSLFTMDRARMAMHAAGRYGSDKTFAEATATLRRLEPGRTRNEAANALGRGLAEAPREDALRRLAAASEAAPQDALTQTDAAFLLSARLAMKDLDGVGDPRVGEIYRRAIAAGLEADVQNDEGYLAALMTYLRETIEATPRRGVHPLTDAARAVMDAESQFRKRRDELKKDVDGRTSSIMIREFNLLQELISLPDVTEFRFTRYPAGVTRDMVQDLLQRVVDTAYRKGFRHIGEARDFDHGHLLFDRDGKAVGALFHTQEEAYTEHELFPGSEYDYVDKNARNWVGWFDPSRPVENAAKYERKEYPEAGGWRAWEKRAAGLRKHFTIAEEMLDTEALGLAPIDLARRPSPQTQFRFRAYHRIQLPEEIPADSNVITVRLPDGKVIYLVLQALPYG